MEFNPILYLRKETREQMVWFPYEKTANRRETLSDHRLAKPSTLSLQPPNLPRNSRLKGREWLSPVIGSCPLFFLGVVSFFLVLLLNTKNFPFQGGYTIQSKSKEYLSLCLSLCLLFWLTSFHKPRTFPHSVFLPHCPVIQSPWCHFSPWKLHHLQA